MRGLKFSPKATTRNSFKDWPKHYKPQSRMKLLANSSLSFSPKRNRSSNFSKPYSNA